MMRNVAIGAVLGFGVMVLVLMMWGGRAEAPAVVAAPVDAGAPAPVLTPLNAAPVIVTPQVAPPGMPAAPEGRTGGAHAFVRERGAGPAMVAAPGDGGP